MLDMNITDLAAGTAAEHLVCADLLLAGHKPFLTDQNVSYDVAVERGRMLLRIQVKSTRAPRALPQRTTFQPGYLFHTRRAGKKGARLYSDGEFDILALVALDTRRIAYVPFLGMRNTMMIRIPGVEYKGRKGIGRRFENLSFESALAGLDAATVRA